MGSAFPHQTSSNNRPSMTIFENITFSIIPSSRFWIPIPRLLPSITQLDTTIFLMASTFSLPSLIEQEVDLSMQLETVTFSVGPNSWYSLLVLKQIQSSA